MCGIRRAEQDEFAVRSQNLAEQAIKNGFYSREITPVELLDGITVDCDDGPRPSVTLDARWRLKPVFRPDGTVQVPGSALLVFLVGRATPGYGGERIVDTLIGARVAVIAVLLSPSAPEPDAVMS